MDDGIVRRAAGRPRKGSSTGFLAANVSPQHGEPLNAAFPREAHSPAGGLNVAARREERRNSAPQVVHQRHMPMEPKKFHIPRKTKEQRALFQHVSMESREYEDMKSILTSSYIDQNSVGCFTYNRPRLVHSELLEKEFVDKRREMKAEGRTEKELEESYCFLLANSEELPLICEKGLTVDHSAVTLLGNPSKGVYLSKYSDLLQASPLTSGASGEIIIFKVMKGKVKSIYENMKNLLDPTPRFDAHIAKNASKVTSLSCYRAFELTQQYFYEYSFDELRPRPRHVCPYAVVFFQVKGKDAPAPCKPLALGSRSMSRSADKTDESCQYTVWTGELVKEDQVLLQISLRSGSSPFLPHRLPEKLQMGNVMRIDHVTKILPPHLLHYNSYSGSKEVVSDGFYCSLLEVTCRNRSVFSVTTLLQELETNGLVLVSPLPERGFLLLLSSVQMAPPDDRRENWKRGLHALFVFQETRDVTKITSHCDPITQESSWPHPPIMPHLKSYIPALHHALVKARANRPPNLSAGVEQQTREYLSGLKDGSVHHYSMSEYDSILDEEEKSLPPPKHHQFSMDSYLHSYLSGPDLYLLSLVQAKHAVEAHLGPEPPQDPRSPYCHKAAGRGVQGNNDHKVQQLLDLVMTCKRNAENELRREKGEGGVPEKKRKMEQETAERALKYFKASQEPGKIDRTPGSKTPLALLPSFGLQDIDLRGNGSELTATLIKQLSGLIQAANQNLNEAQGEGQKESNPFGSLASKLGLPANCDIDLRKQEELEEQTAGSISSLEGFSPGSHSGELNHHGDGGRGEHRRKVDRPEEEENWPIPWILIPITGLSSERYAQRDRNLPQDPRFQLLTTGTSATPSKKSPTPSPEHSPPASIPPPSPAQCPSPVPSPPTSPTQCPSPQPSPPPSPFQCPSPDSSPLSSPLLCQSPDPDASMAPSPSENSPPPPSPSSSQKTERLPPCNQQLDCANEQQPAPQEFQGVVIGGGMENPPGSSSTCSPEPPAAGSCTSPSVMKEEGEGEELNPPVVEETHVKLDERQEECADLGGSRQPELQESAEALRPSSSCSIDTTVDRHLGNFTSGIQILLQEEGIDSDSHQPSAVHSDTATSLRTLPYAPIPRFSHYVTLYNPSPPVQDYVVSLQSSFNGMMAAFKGVCASQTDAGHTDASLASTVQDFVASVRAANAPTGRDDASSVCSEQTYGAVTHQAEIPAEGQLWQSESADWSSPPGVTMPDLSSGFGLVYESADVMDTGIKRTESTATDVCINHEVEKDVLTGPEPTPSEHPYQLGFSNALAPEPEPSPETAPSSKDLNSVIHQLQPDVLNNLLEIMKDIKKNSPQFYIHCPEPGDRVCEEVKELLLRLGNVQQSPVDYLSQESAETGLLVVMRNKDVALHVHEIPGLVSLKQRPSVVFLGIDTLDDIRNSSWTELFVSGGCIVSDELLLNPDTITCDTLAALLQLLEQHSSPESLWRWKIHCKTHKKLKEQARFRRDAANLLDLLAAYQKRQVVEVLPYHHCDVVNMRSPDLDCLLLLQAQQMQFRHMVFLTEHPIDQPSLYSSGGIIVASVEETLQSLSRLVSHHNPKDKSLLLEDLLTPTGLYKQNVDLDSVSECLIVPEPPSQLPGINNPPLPGPCSPPASNQLFTDSASIDPPLTTNSRDMEFLQQAIRQLRAERQEQLRRQEQLELLQSNAEHSPPKPADPINGHDTPPLAPPIPDRTAVKSPSSNLPLLLWDQGRAAEGNCTTSTEDLSDPPPCQNAAAVLPSEAGDEQESAEGGRATTGAAVDDISREAASLQDAAVCTSISAEPTPSNSAPSVVTMETKEKKNSHPPQQQPSLYSQLRQRSVSLLPTPHLPPVYTHVFPPRPILDPRTNMRAMRGFMRPMHLWPGAAPPLIWGFHSPGMEYLRGYHSSGGGPMYRGGRRGGGFSGV